MKKLEDMNDFLSGKALSSKPGELKKGRYGAEEKG